MVYTIQTHKDGRLYHRTLECAVYIATIKKKETTPPNSGRIERQQTLVMMDTDGGAGAGSGTGGVVQLDSGLDDMSLADGRIFLA